MMHDPKFTQKIPDMETPDTKHPPTHRTRVSTRFSVVVPLGCALRGYTYILYEVWRVKWDW